MEMQTKVCESQSPYHFIPTFVDFYKRDAIASLCQWLYVLNLNGAELVLHLGLYVFSLQWL